MPFIGILFSRCMFNSPNFIVGFMSFTVGPARPNKSWQYLLVDRNAKQFFTDEEIFVPGGYNEVVGVRV